MSEVEEFEISQFVCTTVSFDHRTAGSAVHSVWLRYGTGVATPLAGELVIRSLVVGEVSWDTDGRCGVVIGF